jgi:hypothetical protein
MSIHYYIVTAEGQKTGPYDIVGIVKKIRNGSLTAETMIASDNEAEAKKASEWVELAEFLQEQDAEETSTIEVHKVKTTSLSRRLASGWNFLQNNQLSTVFSGLFVLFIIFSTGFVTLLLPKALRMIGHGAFFVITQFLFTGYIYSVLRMVRGQPVDYNFVKEKMRPLVKALIVSSFIMSFFIIVGMLFILSGVESLSVFGLIVVALPGFYMMNLYIFAPLLILDKNVEFWEALELSRKTVKKSGMENVGVIFSLLIINFVGGVFLLVPMIVTLPITMSAISDMYDESFA